jgi:hypothetical protein
MVECDSFDAALQRANAMTDRAERGGRFPEASWDRVNYIKGILPELAELARKEKADMLVYLLEMAFTEATDLLTGRSESVKVDRNHASRMAMKPAGKI